MTATNRAEFSKFLLEMAFSSEKAARDKTRRLQHFGKLLRDFREAHKEPPRYTQAQMVKLIGEHLPTAPSIRSLQHWEAGEQFPNSDARIQAIANVLGVTRAVLFGDIEKKPRRGARGSSAADLETLNSRVAELLEEVGRLRDEMAQRQGSDEPVEPQRSRSQRR